MSEPLNVWFSDGREYTDYRLPNGCIVTIETARDPHPCLRRPVTTKKLPPDAPGEQPKGDTHGHKDSPRASSA